MNLTIENYKYYNKIVADIIPHDEIRKNKRLIWNEFYEKNKNFIQIFFNNNEKEEIKRNYLNENEKVEKIKIIIDHQIKSFGNVFKQANGIKKLKLKSYKSVKDLDYMFEVAYMIEEINLSNFNTENVTNMREMFTECKNLKEIKGINNFKTNKVKDMSGMLGGCIELEFIDLSNFDTSNVTNMSKMFALSSNLRNIKGIDNFNTSKVIDMSMMFSYCAKLEGLNLSNFNTKNVTNFYKMFNSCRNLKEIKGLNYFITNNVTDMSLMFSSCEQLEYLDITSFNTENVTSMNQMFLFCKKLKGIKGINNFSVKRVKNIAMMFFGSRELFRLNSSNLNSADIDLLLFIIKTFPQLNIPIEETNLSDMIKNLIQGFFK